MNRFDKMALFRGRIVVRSQHLELELEFGVTPFSAICHRRTDGELVFFNAPNSSVTLNVSLFELAKGVQLGTRVGRRK